MNKTNYVVSWHEVNATGVPRDIMGVSPVMESHEAALEWINNSVKEDSENAKLREDSLTREDSCSDKCVTRTSGQDVYYHVSKISVRDNSDTCVSDIRNILSSRISCSNRIASALEYINTYEREHGSHPKKEYVALVNFSPVSCEFRVNADSHEEARSAILHRISTLGLDAFTQEQQSTLIDDIVDNVESVTVREII